MFFIGKHTTFVDGVADVSVPDVVDNESSKRAAFDSMLFGLKVGPTDVSMMIPRYNYAADIVYDMYDDTDTNLYAKKFYVIVKNGSTYDVFKCLDNNMGTASTVAPDRNDVDYSDEIYRTSDGYVWKYMYTVPASTVTKFADVNYFPVKADANVTAAAVSGTIDVIKVDYPGARYDNYLRGAIGATDTNIDGDSHKINISGNSLSSSTNNFYNGCIFKVYAGTGLGSYATVSSYTVTGGAKTVTLDDILTLDLTSRYEISPGVEITSGYFQTSNAVARAVVNSVANTIDHIEILSRGSGYRFASAEVPL
jgi:hypothetical protein